MAPSRSPAAKLADFLAGEQQRRRYWARNHLGWRIVDRATPTPAHRDLAALETAGAVGGIITQNIDLLHLKAGSHRLVDIHGNYATIRCYRCGDRRLRHELADELESINPQLADYLLHIQVEAAPDADAEVPNHLIEGFRMVPCRRCGGFYKPDIIYFGEQVPRPRRLLAEQLVDQADALVVLGSSLSVYSGKRFVKRAARAGTPIIIANRGHTGGDQYATVRVDVDVNLFTAAWREAYRANR